LVVGILGCWVVGTVSAAVVDANVAVVSKYMWRGMDSNLTQPAVQPGVTYYTPINGLSLGLWGSYNIGSITNKEMTEVDYIVTYTSALSDALGYSLTYNAYTYPNNAAAKTAEIILNLTANQLSFTPTLLFAYDAEQFKQWYASLGGKTSFALGRMDIASCLTVGYNNGQYNIKPGISDANLTFSTNLPVGSVTLTPSVNYTWANADNGVNVDANTFWFGLTIAGSI